MEVKGHECLQRSQELIMLSQDMLYFYVLFMQRREDEHWETKMAIVFSLPAMDVMALAKALDRQWGLVNTLHKNVNLNEVLQQH